MSLIIRCIGSHRAPPVNSPEVTNKLRRIAPRVDLNFQAARRASHELQRAGASSDAFTEIRADGTAEEWDEFRSEQQLRECDTLGEKYRRLLEKYADHSDSERLIAHEMGWERIDEEPDADEADEIARMNEICKAALDADL